MFFQKQTQRPTISDSQSNDKFIVGSIGPTKKLIHKNRHKKQIESAKKPYKQKKGQKAKQIKRLREQNRRANHKSYVANLQLQLKQKDIQIEKLETKIQELQEQLQAKKCYKCGIHSNFTGNCHEEQEAPNQLMKERSINKSEEADYNDSLKRMIDDSSLRVCFGSKSLLFFLVTMCCLTMGSIADNQQAFLQPINPNMFRSDYWFLKFSIEPTRLQLWQKQDIFSDQIKYVKGQGNNKIPRVYKQINRVSQSVVLKWLNKKQSSKWWDMLKTRQPGQILLNFLKNYFIQQVFNGIGFYI